MQQMRSLSRLLSTFEPVFDMTAVSEFLVTRVRCPLSSHAAPLIRTKKEFLPRKTVIENIIGLNPIGI